jgi:hypothetical protein
VLPTTIAVISAFDVKKAEKDVCLYFNRVLRKYENGWKIVLKVSLLFITNFCGRYKTNEPVTYQLELEEFINY